MWRLTIYQKKVTTYKDHGEDKTFESEESIVYESEYLDRLNDILEATDTVYHSNETRYEFRKAVD